MAKSETQAGSEAPEQPATETPVDVAALMAELEKTKAELAEANRTLDDLTAPKGAKLKERTDFSTPIWKVHIPGCLVGERFVQASGEHEAIQKYKKPAGIWCHEKPAVAVPAMIDSGKGDGSAVRMDPANLPEDVELYGD